MATTVGGALRRSLIQRECVRLVKQHCFSKLFVTPREYTFSCRGQHSDTKVQNEGQLNVTETVERTDGIGKLSSINPSSKKPLHVPVMLKEVIEKLDPKPGMVCCYLQ